MFLVYLLRHRYFTLEFLLVGAGLLVVFAVFHRLENVIAVKLAVGRRREPLLLHNSLEQGVFGLDGPALTRQLVLEQSLH